MVRIKKANEMSEKKNKVINCLDLNENGRVFNFNLNSLLLYVLLVHCTKLIYNMRHRLSHACTSYVLYIHYIAKCF